MKIKVLFYIFILMLGLTTSAMAQYGFEWIRPYQPYYKIKVVNTGVYSIDSLSLASNGIVLTGIHPKRFQLFRNGVEQFIYVAGQDDGVFNKYDYIEFWGERNDGKIDSQLYVSPADQPHQWASLFSDTSVYFLTILPDTSVVTAKRFGLSFSTGYSSFVPESYFMHETKVFPTNEYVDGINLNPGGEKYSSSEYTDGEGWADYRRGLNDIQTWTFNTPNYASVAVSPTIDLKIIGVSDYVLSNAPNNHHARFSVAKFETPSFTTITDLIYKGYVSKSYSGNLTAANFGVSKTVVKMEIVNDLSVASDFNCLSYIRLTYPRLYNLSGETEMGINVLHTQGGGRSRLSLGNYGTGQTNPYAYDFTSGQRIVGIMNGGNAEILINNSGTPSKVYVFDSIQTTPVTRMTKVNFRVIDAANAYDMIIVTSPVLDEAANAYVNYRSQKYSVLKVFSEELYDFYTFGNMHPLAVRRMVSHLLKESTHKPQYLLLLGKGYQGDLLKSEERFAQNLVPAIGVPASDVMFSAGIVGSGFTNDIATGRIPASSNSDLQNYLNKLINYETNPDSILPWRKNILHISGGNDLSQQTPFKNQLAQNAATIRGKKFGANVISYNKDNTESVSLNVKQELIKTIDNGVTMLSFLGHGSAMILDVDFGGINEINNQDKHTFFYFNGCNIGNPSAIDPVKTDGLYGKFFICAERKGAIGWLAHSNLTLDGKLYAQMNGFYNQLCIQQYAGSIGQIIKANGEAMANADVQLRSHSYQLTLMGDPAVKIYSPVKPDYAIGNSSLYMDPPDATTQLDSVSIGVICTNLGKAQDDSVTVSLTHLLPNNVRKQYQSVFPKPIYFKDTMYIRIPLFKELTIGNNTFEVTVDAENELDEISKVNNKAQFSYYLPGNGIKALVPAESSIVNDDTVSLIIQNNDLRVGNTEYLFEIDTTPYFNSPLLQQSGIITSSALCRWNVNLTAPDQTVYFWRSRINVDPDKGGLWDTSTFTLERTGVKGWQQSHWGQYQHVSEIDQLIIKQASPVNLEFIDNGLEVIVKQARWQHSNYGTFDPYYNNPSAGSCVGSGIICVKYNGVSLAEDEVSGTPFNCTPVPGYQYYAFDTKTIAGQNAFISMIDSAKTGDYFAMYSYYDAGIPNWSTGMREALARIGSVKAASVTSYYSCFVIIGRKGEAPGSAIEDTVTNTQFESQNAADSLVLTVRRLLIGKWYKGSMTSEQIGPVKSWDSLSCSFHSMENNGADRVYITLIAQNNQGKDTIVIPETSSLDHSLSFIDARKYPYLRIRASFLDSMNRTPNQFGKWKVTYQPASEGTINAQRAFTFYKSSIEQGDSLQISFAFDNISDVPFDSLPISFNILNANREVKYSYHETGARLGGNNYALINRKIPTTNLSGLNTLNVTVNGDRSVPEVELNNNYLSLGFDVKTDHSSPVLDVTFDGYRIMNGDFVSPTPLIRLQSKDDNKFRIQQDTGTFALYLKRPGNSDYERIAITSPEVVFKAGNSVNNTATIEYKPQRFSDGKYSLKVQAVDASGNISGNNSYEIEFTVVNESTITNFFPYPNPGTTNIRFVFTLTGSKPPEQLLIRIMTITGKVVKEITQNEFGRIKIGNNISEYGWDGTDNFGDRLANGVYLYQVMTRIEGQSIKKRDTSADQYVTHNTGKIYLLK